MNRQQNTNPTPPQKQTNWLLIFLHVIGLPLELVMHNVMTFGVRSISARVIGALIIMFFFVGYYEKENGGPLTDYMILVGVLSLVGHISARIRLYRGEGRNSRYTGRPYLMWLVPRWSEETVKRLEPCLAWAVGGIIYHFNHPLGAFVVWSAVGVAIKVGNEVRGNYNRMLEINDTLMQQKMAINSVRRMQRR